MSNPEDHPYVPSFAGLCEFEACLWDWEPRYQLGFHTMGRCRRCGCTERRACRDGGHGCHWANDRATLCSRCAAQPTRRRFRRRRLSREAVKALRAYWRAELAMQGLGQLGEEW